MATTASDDLAALGHTFAAFCDEILPMVVHKYRNLRAQGEQASR